MAKGGDIQERLPEKIINNQLLIVKLALIGGQGGGINFFFDRTFFIEIMRDMMVPINYKRFDSVFYYCRPFTNPSVLI